MFDMTEVKIKLEKTTKPTLIAYKIEKVVLVVIQAGLVFI